MSKDKDDDEKIELAMDGEVTEFKKRVKSHDDGAPLGALAVSIERCDNGWVLRVAAHDEEAGEVVESSSVFSFDQKGMMFGLIDKNL